MQLVCNQVTESTDSGTEVESQDQPLTATVQDDQSEATEFTEHLKQCEDTEPTYKPGEEPEQTTGPSLKEAFIL